MEKSKSYIGKIDSAFSYLLMSRSMLEKIIPDSDSEKAIELACSLVAQLLKSAIDELSPTEHSFLSPTERFRPRYGADNGEVQGCLLLSPPLIDVDARVAARLREFITTPFQ